MDCPGPGASGPRPLAGASGLGPHASGPHPCSNYCERALLQVLVTIYAREHKPLQSTTRYVGIIQKTSKIDQKSIQGEEWILNSKLKLIEIDVGTS